jgi:hypothetical protein
MATAKLIRPKPALPGVTLELTGEEAQALILLFQNVGGEPNGFRGRVNAIAEALASATMGQGFTTDSRGLVSGSLYFK